MVQLGLLPDAIGFGDEILKGYMTAKLSRRVMIK